MKELSQPIRRAEGNFGPEKKAWTCQTKDENDNNKKTLCNRELKNLMNWNHLGRNKQYTDTKNGGGIAENKNITKHVREIQTQWHRWNSGLCMCINCIFPSDTRSSTLHWNEGKKIKGWSNNRELKFYLDSLDRNTISHIQDLCCVLVWTVTKRWGSVVTRSAAEIIWIISCW